MEIEKCFICQTEIELNIEQDKYFGYQDINNLCLHRSDGKDSCIWLLCTKCSDSTQNYIEKERKRIEYNKEYLKCKKFTYNDIKFEQEYEGNFNINKDVYEYEKDLGKRKDKCKSPNEAGLRLKHNLLGGQSKKPENEIVKENYFIKYIKDNMPNIVNDNFINILNRAYVEYGQDGLKESMSREFINRKFQLEKNEYWALKEAINDNKIGN